jgi:hypothetical protein
MTTQDAVRVGDIVQHDGHSWDVVGEDLMLPRERDGYQPVRLHLQRVKREEGKRKQVTKAQIDSRQVSLIGRQVAMPGLPLTVAEGPHDDHRS